MALERKASRKSGRHPSSSSAHHRVPAGHAGQSQRQQSTERTPPTTAAKCKSYGRKAIAFLFSHVGLCALGKFKNVQLCVRVSRRVSTSTVEED